MPTTANCFWQRTVAMFPARPRPFPEILESTGYAAPTMATDGQRAFVMFGNGDVAAFNFDGALAWSKHLGVPKNMMDHAASLAIAPGKLIVQMDQDEGARAAQNYWRLMARRGATLGAPQANAWFLGFANHRGGSGKTQIITLALLFVMAHALADGGELWRAELMNGEVAPSRCLQADWFCRVLSSDLVAIRPDGAGDVTKSHVAWKASDNIPDITSPSATVN